MLGVQASYLIFFRLRGAKKTINRRLAVSKQLTGTDTLLDVLRRERGVPNLENPTLSHLNDLVMQTGLTLNRTLLAFSVPAFTVVFFFAFGVALGYCLSAFLMALVVAVLAVVWF